MSTFRCIFSLKKGEKWFIVERKGHDGGGMACLVELIRTVSTLKAEL